MTTADKRDLEEGRSFTPRFDDAGLIVCVTTDAASGSVLMVAYMNRQALDATLDSGIMTYWSRSRGSLWRKGDTSGQVQHLVELRTDCDQDALLASVRVGGDGGGMPHRPGLLFLPPREPYRCQRRRPRNDLSAH